MRLSGVGVDEGRCCKGVADEQCGEGGGCGAEGGMRRWVLLYGIRVTSY
jgi:hypothetical protein